MRPRDLSRLESRVFDLLIVGGGVYGLACAYEGASRGLSVALVDAGDFGSGTSFNHQKTAHGGLRSLGSGDLRRARESIHERRALARIAPWLLRPLPFLVGTYRSLARSRSALRAAFRLDAWLGRRRNDGVEPELHLPPPRLVSRAATLRLFSGIRGDGLTGGAQWYDYQMVESDRLTVAFAEAADRCGATLASHAAAVEAITEDGRIVGMQVRDALSGAAVAVRARLTLNAAGAHAGTVMAMFGVKRPFPLVKAMNLVTSRPASDIGLAAPGPSGRMLTLVPWRGRAIVGTSQSAGFVQPGDTAVGPEEVAAFIADANHAFPALQLLLTDVSLVHRGVVPAVAGRHGGPELKPLPDVFDHAADGAAGALTVAGVKYTTARGVAERVIDLAGARLGQPLTPSRSGTTTLPGAGLADHDALAIEAARGRGVDLTPDAIRHLVGLYAEATPTLVALIAERPELAAPVAAAVPTLGAEVVHAIRHEMALRLADIVVRRTGLGSAGRPAPEALRACARLAAAELAWSPARTEEEIALTSRVYDWASI
ncbi:MAG: FAD-dependent oxidoreductase [Acidobacteriota bacterium]